MACRTNTWANFWLCSCNVKWHQCEIHCVDPEAHSEPRQSRKRQNEQHEPTRGPKRRQPQNRQEDVLQSNLQLMIVDADCEAEEDHAENPRATNKRCDQYESAEVDEKAAKKLC